ncbi:TetR/AcrR family transcriptional regulator [Marinobacter sp. R17]|uniref:TetR/AcrR family transcriptional regulator n=1 Tax=Marinobacter sp. R17 TaxID=2484250 RepID=UPI001681C257|nr:TetR/AcrR family transcriptional regulator [Marinobacter sp. R17]
MKEKDNKLVNARKPTQERSRERVERMFQAAEKLLLEQGPESLSIPEVAKTSGLPRSSVYQFFPSKYALLLAISDQYEQKLVDRIAGLDAVLGNLALADVMGSLARTAADFYNEHPIACILILGGPMSRDGFRAGEDSRMGTVNSIRYLIERRMSGVEFPTEPDVIAFAIEIARGCFKYGYFREKTISDQTVAETRTATYGYLSTRLRVSKPATID